MSIQFVKKKIIQKLSCWIGKNDLLVTELINNNILDNVCRNSDFYTNVREDKHLLNVFVSHIVEDKKILDKFFRNEGFYKKICEDEHFLNTFYRRIGRNSDLFDKTISSKEFNDKFLIKIITLYNLGLKLNSLDGKVKWTGSEELIKFCKKIAEYSISEKTIHKNCIEILTQDNNITIGKFKYSPYNNSTLWSLLHEILIYEEYYFESDNATPLMIDCGTHNGLAIIYFKTLYPEGKVIGFEPSPEIRELALKNIEQNNLKDVSILPFALAKEEGEAVFHIASHDSRAGSLTSRMSNRGYEVKPIKVECKRLSKYLTNKVDFLKLDIEGTEDDVLEECKQYLKNVKYLFCEYHVGDGLAAKRLPKILEILDDAGFKYHISKSWSSEKLSQKRPLCYIDKNYSHVIWAKNQLINQ